MAPPPGWWWHAGWLRLEKIRAAVQLYRCFPWLVLMETLVLTDEQGGIKEGCSRDQILFIANRSDVSFTILHNGSEPRQEGLLVRPQSRIPSLTKRPLSAAVYSLSKSDSLAHLWSFSDSWVNTSTCLGKDTLRPLLLNSTQKRSFISRTYFIAAAEQMTNLNIHLWMYFPDYLY